MARASKGPGRKEVLAALKAHNGVVAQAALSLGVSETTMGRLVARHSLKETLAEIRERAAVEERAKRARPVTDPERVQEDQLREEVKLLKRENSDYAKALASQEGLFDRIVEATRISVEKPAYKPARQKATLPARSVVLPIYDLQFGAHVVASDTPGRKGSYDSRVFDQRLARYIEGVEGSLRDYAASHRLQEALIVLGGDMVEGDEIFPGQSWQLELDPPRQVWELAVKLGDALQRIIATAKSEFGIPKVGIYAVPGNHGKVGGKRGGARPTTYSWDWLLFKILADRLRAEPVEHFAIEPGGAVLFGAADFVFLAIHGDEIRGWGGLPFYGLTKFDGRAMRLHQTVYDYLLMGHHHQPASIPNGSGETIVSGDWMGGTNLSRMMTAASRPQQNVLFVARKWGITEVARIYLQSAAQAYSATPVHRV